MDYNPSTLHPDWDKNETRGMFSHMKPRNVEPLQYDKKVDFWSKCIAKYCENSKSAVVNFAELRNRFRRGDLLPTPLEGVMIELYKKGELQSEDDIARKEQGWLAWSVSLVNPFAGNGPDVKSHSLIHINTVTKLAAQLREFRHKLMEEDDEAPEVISYNELREKTRHIIKDEVTFKLAINHLIKCGDILEGKTKSGERILKFRDQRSRSPGKVTEADASAHEIRLAIRKIEQDLKRLEGKEAALKEQAKQALRNSNKSFAKSILAKKQRVLKEIESKDGQLRQLTNMLEKILETRQTKDILDVYRIGNQAFKDALSRQGLSVDTIDKTIDDMHDTMEGIKEINDVISGGFVPADQRIDEAELEDELNAMIEADATADRNNTVKVNKNIIDISSLPEVPSSSIPVNPSSVPITNISDSLEARMRRLREQA